MNKANCAKLQASYIRYNLEFTRPSGTSRGVLLDKNTWFLIVYDKDNTGVKGIGECSPLKGLSIDDRNDYEDKLKEVCAKINEYTFLPDDELEEFPSIKFGLETALQDFNNQGAGIIFPSEFTAGARSIKINGLIWMGDLDYMKEQVDQKLKQGFDCIKLKIGALDFDKELALLEYIRSRYSAYRLEVRVDANGAFTPEEALDKLARLAPYKIHSIEQPIRAGQWEQLAGLARSSPIPIALDEELIGHSSWEEKKRLLQTIRPKYIIIKPSLLGGFKASTLWIDLAEKYNIGWWITSALESNIGLNAIAQWAYTLNNTMPQGLGTGQLFTNNIKSPLQLQRDRLYYQPSLNWDLTPLLPHTP